jgi:hypothetical protein
MAPSNTSISSSNGSLSASNASQSWSNESLSSSNALQSMPNDKNSEWNRSKSASNGRMRSFASGSMGCFYDESDYVKMRVCRKRLRACAKTRQLENAKSPSLTQGSRRLPSWPCNAGQLLNRQPGNRGITLGIMNFPRIILVAICLSIPTFSFAGTCSPTGTCKACTTCSSCGHCAKGGGKCSVCR